MAWEWVAPAAGAVVGVAGLAGGWLTARISRRHDLDMVEIRHRWDRDGDEVRWRRERRTDAYLAVLEIVATTGTWMRHQQALGTGDESGLPSTEDSDRAWAAFTAFATGDAWDAGVAWDDARRKARRLRRQVNIREPSTWSRFDEARAEEEERRLAFAEQIALELGGRSPGRSVDRR